MGEYWSGRFCQEELWVTVQSRCSVVGGQWALQAHDKVEAVRRRGAHMPHAGQFCVQFSESQWMHLGF